MPEVPGNGEGEAGGLLGSQPGKHEEHHLQKAEYGRARWVSEEGSLLLSGRLEFDAGPTWTSTHARAHTRNK